MRGTFGVDQYIKVICSRVAVALTTQFLLHSARHAVFLKYCISPWHVIALRISSTGSKEKVEVVGAGDSGGNDSYAQNGRAGVRLALSKRYEQQIKVLLV